MIKKAMLLTTPMIIRLLLLVNLQFISLNCYAEISRPSIKSQSASTIYTIIFVTDIDEVDSADQSFVLMYILNSAGMTHAWQQPVTPPVYWHLIKPGTPEYR